MKLGKSKSWNWIITNTPANCSSVIALSKLYALDEPVLGQIQVKGDLIVPESDVIMTRSRTRKSKNTLSPLFELLLTDYSFSS
jgi:hypothetical protein